MKKIFAVAGKVYLGSKEGRTITGINVSNFDKVKEDDFANFMKAEAVDELVTIEFGKNTNFTSRKLDNMEEISKLKVEAEYEASAQMAGGFLNNMVFDKLRGK